MSVNPPPNTSPNASQSPQSSTPPGTAPQEPQQFAQPPRAYEPGPSAGKLMSVLLLFVLAAVVVVWGGVYFTSGG